MKHNQKGFSAVEAVIVIVVVAVLGFAGWFVWQSQNKKDDKKTTSSQQSTNDSSKGNSDQTKDEYAGWQSYSDAEKAYTVKYPSDWKTYDTGTKPRVAEDVISLLPKDLPTSNPVVTVAHFKSDASAKGFMTQDGPLKGLVEEKDVTINGLAGYYARTGDGTYTSRVYAVKKGDNVITISLAEKSTATKAIDNTAYADEFELIAKSITL